MNITSLVSGILAYLCSAVASTLVSKFPHLPQYNKWLLVGAIILTVLSYSLSKNVIIKKPPGLAPFLLFFAYGVGHDVLYPSIVDLSIATQVGKFYLIYVLAITACRDRSHYITLIKLLYIFTALTLILFYYFYFVLSGDFGIQIESGKRIHAESVDLELNVNTVSYLACLHYIISIRLAELVPGKLTATLQSASYVVATVACVINQSLLATFLVVLFFAVSMVSRRITSKQMITSNLPLVGVILYLTFTSSHEIDVVTFLWQRVELGSSFDERGYLLNAAFQVFSDNLLSGTSYDSIVTSVGINHAFYINVAAVLGSLGFVLFAIFMWAVLVPNGGALKLSGTTPSQWIARVFLLAYLAAAPPMPILAIALILTFSFKEAEAEVSSTDRRLVQNRSTESISHG